MVEAKPGQSSHKVDRGWCLQHHQSGATLQETLGNSNRTDASGCSLVWTKTSARAGYKRSSQRCRLPAARSARFSHRPFAAVGVSRSRLVRWPHSQDVALKRDWSMVFDLVGRGTFANTLGVGARPPRKI